MASIQDTLTLEVATPSGWALQPMKVSSVQAPSVFGEFGVLPGHLPLLVALKAGPIHYVVDGTTKHAAMGGTGYAQVEKFADGSGKLRVLAEFFLEPADIDLEAAQADLDDAVARSKKSDDDASLSAASRDEAWARARLEVGALTEA